jgi:hypothetical protein
MDMYNKWLIEQQRTAGSNRKAEISSMEKK